MESHALEKATEMAPTTSSILSGVAGGANSPRVASVVDMSFIQGVYSKVSGLR